MAPNILYHYCSLETLINILNNQTIRVSDIRKMNDCEERKWFFSKFIEELKQQKFIERFEDHYIKSELEHLYEYWEVYFLPGGGYPEYIFCLSSNGDVLSQWRAYADDGNGVSIGFSFETLSKLITNDNPCFSLNEVEYFDNKDEIARRVDALKSELDKNLKEQKYDYFDTMLNLMRNDKYPFIKNPAFKEELEWRLILYPGKTEYLDNEFEIENFIIGSLNYKAIRNNIVGYRDIDFSMYKNEIIREIIIGPKCKATPHIDIPALLYALGYQNCKIETRVSTATYI